MLKNSIKKENNIEISNLRDFIIEIIDDFVDFTIADEKYLLFAPYIKFNDSARVDSFIGDAQRARLHNLIATNKKFFQLLNYYTFFHHYLLSWFEVYEDKNGDYITFITKEGNLKIYRFELRSATRTLLTLTDQELNDKSIEELLKSLIYKSIYSIVLEVTNQRHNLEKTHFTKQISNSDNSSIKDEKSIINESNITSVGVFVCTDTKIHEKFFNRDYSSLDNEKFKRFMINLYFLTNGIQQSLTLKDKLKLLKTLEEDPENIEKEVKTFYNLLVKGIPSHDLPLTPEALDKLKHKLLEDIRIITKSTKEPKEKKEKKSNRRKREQEAALAAAAMHQQIHNHMVGGIQNHLEVFNQAMMEGQIGHLGLQEPEIVFVPPPVEVPEHVWVDMADWDENHIANVIMAGDPNNDQVNID